MPGRIVIIPARGGSKGIPHKNILPLGGKPLIAWNIEASLGAKCIDRVIVSTDDDRIAKVAQQYGAEVVRRPEAISGDIASSESALLHVLEHLREHENYIPDELAFLQCTSPLTASIDIDATVEAMHEQQADTALAVIRFHYFLWRHDENGGAVGINHEKSVRLMRQQREPEYLETGAIYVMKTQGFLTHKHRFFGKTATYVMPAERRLEIDELSDFALAQGILGNQTVAARHDPKNIRALVLDFDGVLTDNRVWVDQDGGESVACSRDDGMGLSLAKQAGLALLVISKERNPVVAARCKKLGIECLQGIDDKRTHLLQWLDKNSLSAEQTAYVGNDVNDLPCLTLVGMPIGVADTHRDVVTACRWLTRARGGHGAVREVCDWLLQKRH